MDRFDPRSKLVWTLAGIVAIFLTSTVSGQIAIPVVMVLMMRLSSLRLLQVLRKLRFLAVLLPFTFLVHVVFSTTMVSAVLQRSLPSFTWSELWVPVAFTLRLGNLFVLMAFVVRWIPAVEFLDGIYLILKPLQRLKFPVDDFFQVIFIAVRFFPLLREEYRNLDEGWKTFVPTRPHSIRERLAQLRQRLIPLMIFSFRKAEILADAMTIRGYGSGGARTYYTQLKYGSADFRFAAAGFILLLLTIWMNSR